MSGTHSHNLERHEAAATEDDKRFTLSDYVGEDTVSIRVDPPSDSVAAEQKDDTGHFGQTADPLTGRAGHIRETWVTPPGAAYLAPSPARLGGRPSPSSGRLRLHVDQSSPIPLIIPPRSTSSAHDPLSADSAIMPTTSSNLRMPRDPSASSSVPYAGYLDPAPMSVHTPDRPTDSFLSVRSTSGQTDDTRSARSLAYSDLSGSKPLVDDEDKIELADIPSASLPHLPRSASYSASIPTSWLRRTLPATLACRLLLLVVFLQAIFDLCIEGNILYRFREEVRSSASTEIELENKRRLPVYLVIFGLAHVWQITLAIVAIRTKNTIQVISLTLFNFAFLGYAVIEVWELRKILGQNLEEVLQDGDINSHLLSLPLNVLTGVVIGIIGFCSLCLVVLSYFLRNEFGWQRYRFLGADLRIRTLYYRFQIFECVCYFSAFFCAGFGIQFIWLVLQKTDAEYVVTWVMFPLSILLLIMGRFAAKYEQRIAMYAFFTGLTCGIAYFTFKLVRIWQQDDTVYSGISTSLTVFAALSVVSLLSSMLGGFIVSRGFGEGLRKALTAQPGMWTGMAEKLRRMRGGKEVVVDEEARMHEMAAKRISID